MQADRRFLVVLVLMLTIWLPATAGEGEPAAGEATLPIEEILRLYRETEEAKKKPDVAPPPVQATIHRYDITGRLLDGAVDLTVQFEIVVLEDGKWVSVPLIKHDPATHVSALPKLPHGVFFVDDGYLRFATQRKGTYAFEVSLLKQAERAERRRSVRFEYDKAALAVCRVSFDKGLFRLRNGDAIERSDGTMLLPQDGAFVIEWERRKEAAEAKKRDAPPPAIESTIPVAHASAVSTLEGRRVIRTRYELRFAGTKTIAIEIPEDLTVERAYLNGVSVPLKLDGTTLPIEVKPVREGDQSAALELVLASSRGAYFLSGSLEVELPRVSWPVNQLFLSVHLPQVFNYNWSGGSLSPVDQAPDASYTYDVPLPGKQLTFHQHLISASAPNVTLDYAVDLEGHYYRP